MDSCILATVDEGRVVNDLPVKDSNEVEVTSLEEAKSVIAALRARQRAQAQQMLAWRRTLKLQVSFNYEEEVFSRKAIPKPPSPSPPLSRLRPRRSLGESARNAIDRSYYPLKTIKHARPEPMLRTVKY